MSTQGQRQGWDFGVTGDITVTRCSHVAKERFLSTRGTQGGGGEVDPYRGGSCFRVFVETVSLWDCDHQRLCCLLAQ